MAKAFYNELSHSADAEAAGTVVKEPGQTLAERKRVSNSKNFYVLDAMQELGIDMSQATRRQLTPEMLEHYDKVISMENEDRAPKWLVSSPKYDHWDVADPRGQDLETTRKARDIIKQKVEELLSV